jgi:transcriptional antiterminator RfaH
LSVLGDECVRAASISTIEADRTLSPLRWHLVFTKASGENTAKLNLERQGYQVYLPRMCRKVLKRGAWRETISALFPRYLFVQLNAAMQSLAPIRSTLGVTQVVRFGSEYLPVPPAIIADLINREDQRGLHRLSFGSVFKPGAAVRVISGVLGGMEGIFEREDANDRVTILLSLLGRETCIGLTAADIAPVNFAY